MITHWDEVEGEPARARAHRGLLAGADGLQLDHRRRAAHLGRRRAGGRRRCISRARRRRSSTSSRARVSRTRARAATERRSPVGPGDCLVHLALEHAHTIGAGDDGLVVLAFGQRHYAANTLLPRAGVSWLGPTWVLEGRRRITRGRARPPSGRRPGRSWPSGRRGSSTSPTFPRASASTGTVSSVVARPRRRRRVGADRALALRRRAGEADEPSARALGRGGDLRRPRGQRARCCSIRARARAARSRSSRAGGLHDRAARRHAARARDPGGRRRHDAARVRDARLRTTSSTTRAPGRSASAVSGVIGRLEQVDYWDGED